MLCETLKPCLINGTTWKEPKMGNRVNIVPKRSELVRFFLIDNNNNNENCPLKTDLNLERICDLVVSFAMDSTNIKVLCLVELKGHKVRDAIAQIVCVYKSLKPRCNHSDQQNIKWMAFISVPASVHIMMKKEELEDCINRDCGIRNRNDYICCKIQKTNGKDELGSFIRAKYF